jgi:hypothetical protein
VAAVRIRPDGMLLAAADVELFWLWNIDTQELISTIDRDVGTFDGDMVFNLEGDKLFVNEGPEIIVRDVPSLEPVQALVGHPQHPVAPNILQQDVTAQRPNEKWLADMTYISTHEGWLYLAVILDVCSRKIVDWSLSKRQHKALVLDALRMALIRREIMYDLLHHSDRGS